jgi:hypothetical protein
VVYKANKSGVSADLNKANMASATSCLFDSSKNAPKSIIAMLLASPGVMPNIRGHSSAINLCVFHVVVHRDKLHVDKSYPNPDQRSLP